MRDAHRWLRRLTVLGTGLLLLLLGTAAPASAHAALRGTDPADGTVLKSAPRRVTLTFTESVGLLTDSFRVYDPRNRRLRTGEADHAPGRSDTARVPLPARLGTGTYTVTWRVVSADSHPVSGALTFSVGERTAAPAAPLPDRAENRATTSLYDIARYLAYLSVALLLGTVAFVAYCRPPGRTRLRRPALAAWWVLLASTGALFLLRAPYEEGTAPARAFALSALTRTATTRPGELLLARLALLLLAAACVPFLRRGPWRRVPRRALLTAAALGSAALSVTWAAAEHASAGPQVPVAVASAALHLLAMAAWLGGLAALLLTLRRDTAAEPAPAERASAEPASAEAASAGAPEPVARTVARFSRLAFASVAVLAVTGVYQSWRGLGSWQALTGTAYGHILLAKLAAVALLLAAASRSRRWTARLASPAPAARPARVPEPATGPPLPAGPPEPVPDTPPAPAPHHLRRPVLAELATGVLVLVLTTLLTSTLPGRAEAEAARSEATAAGIPAASVTTVPFDVGTPGGHGKVQITLDPGRVGANTVQAVVYGPDGGLASVPELRLAMVLPAQRVGPLDARLTDRGGYWAADSFALPIPGTWTMKVTVRVSDVDQVTVSKSVRVVR
ncbi:copper resistance CopC/CopD family protein [Streptomyces sp. DSM 118148]|uniref:copper resistance CopC/CopD family protein n=1 Tax=Streptomyces sp. DSM 118148 TaxID=3448667 RepID=UPI00403FF824